MEKKEFAKKCIAESLFELLKEKPLDKIQVQELVEKSGYSRMAYYRNFDSIEEVLDYYFDTKVESCLSKAKSVNTKDNFEEYLIKIFIYLKEHREFFDVLWKRGLVSKIRERFLRYIPRETFGGEFYYYSFMTGGIFNVYSEWAHNNYKETPEELVSVLLSYVSKLK